MKKITLILLSLFSLTAYSQTYPWPEGLPCGRHTGLNIDDKLVDNYTQYNWYSSSWREVIEIMAAHMQKPDLKLSFDYLQFRQGYQVMRAVEYGSTCDTIPEDEPEVTELKELQKTRKLTKEDFKGPNWIHNVSAIDVEEANCLSLSKINGKTGGCGDQWQDGITEDEAVCFKGKTYIKCHITCIEKIYDRKIEVEPGFCK